MPKLSIITVNLNNAKGLQKTIESVINQTFADYEYIIIDGGSNDESKEIIKKYVKKITYWVSEPDNGIYNGMNKGIKIAKGEYCLFLNSGDWLISNKILKSLFDLEFNEDIVYGNIQTPVESYIYPDEIKLSTFFFKSLGHPASFIKRILFDEYGLYNEKNEIVSDWVFFIKTLIINKCSYKHINLTITFYELDGISINENFRDIHISEREKFLRNSFPYMYDDYVEMGAVKQELEKYKTSRLIKFVVKMQKSNIFVFFKKYL